MTLHDRVRALVDYYFGGSVNAAAKAWRVPQPSAQRLYAGTTQSPRNATLERIALAHGTSVQWLRTGKGGRDPIASPVAVRTSTSEYDRWERLILRLGLERSDAEAVLALPGGVAEAFEDLLVGVEVGDRKQDRKLTPKQRKAVARAWTRAERLSYQSWYEMASALLEAFGPKALCKAFESARYRVRLGFTPFGDTLLGHRLTADAIMQIKVDYDLELEEVERLLAQARRADNDAERDRLQHQAAQKYIEINQKFVTLDDARARATKRNAADPL